jgi:hypothetical protein
MKIFVTGATGFIGGAIARRLKDQHTIGGLARSEQADKSLKDRGITPVRGDLLGVKADQLTGYDVVIHCAAYVEEWGTKKDFFETNVVGTRNLLEASRAAGVRRFIFISTEAAFFDGGDLINIDETIQYPKSTPYLYSASKAEAERLVLSAGTSDFATLSLRPRFVWGPGDQSVLPALIEMVEQCRFAWISNGAFKISSTHIDNLVHAVEQALELGQSGEAFFIADEGEVGIREFLGKLLETQGVHPPTRSISKTTARAAAWIIENAWKVLHIQSKPPLVRFSVDMLSANCTVNTSKAKQVLKYNPPVSREDGLARMAQPNRSAN